MKESGDLYQALINLGTEAGEAIVMLRDIDGKKGMYTFISDQWVRITGYSKEELLNMSFFDIVHEEDRNSSMERHSRKIAGESVPGLYESRIIHKDGHIVVVQLTGAFTIYQDKPANVIYMRDISEQKKLEKELFDYKYNLTQLVKERTAQLQVANDNLRVEIIRREKAEKEIVKQQVALQHLLDAIPAGIYLLDKAARITYVNKAGVKSIEMPFKDIIGKNAMELHPDRESSPEALEADWRVLSTGQSERSIFSNYEPKGLRWFTLDRYPYHDADNNIIGVIIVEIEITDRIQIETQLKQVLEQERILRDRVEAQIKQRIEFTRALVHELKTPLTPIIMASEILAKQQPTEELSSTARLIYNGSVSMNERIDELLDLAKGEIGLLKLNCQPHNIVEIVSEICSYMAYTFKAKKQDFTVEIPPQLPIINIDDQRIRQILINLLDNASKYTPRMGKINLRVSDNEDGIMIQVADTGLGISNEKQDKIFEPYYGLKTDDQPHRGMGLGLSLTKMLVNLHGGNISIDSTEGHGSTFKVTLPYQRNP